MEPMTAFYNEISARRSVEYILCFYAILCCVLRTSPQSSLKATKTSEPTSIHPWRGVASTVRFVCDDVEMASASLKPFELRDRPSSLRLPGQRWRTHPRKACCFWAHHALTPHIDESYKYTANEEDTTTSCETWWHCPTKDSQME